MYQVTGQILNLFNSPKTDKYEATHKVQLLGDSLTVDGQVKKEMITLNVPEAVFNSLRGQVGREATFPIGFYVKNGNLITFFPKSEADNVEIAGAKKAA
jgi:hypothetical protein